MASNFEKYAYTKNGVVETSSLLATNYGRHIMNVVAEADLENGCVAVIGEYVEPDVYKAVAPTDVKEAIVLIASEPKIYEEYTSKMQEESQFYIKTGEIAQADDLDRYDRFALSPAAFHANAVPALKEYVGIVPNSFKLNTLGTTAPTGRGFIGIIDTKLPNGNYLIRVIKNTTVEA